jgi:4-amino-4-deoxy-L-arabinose transferase-like glycosyltransferase
MQRFASEPQARLWWIGFALAAASFAATLMLPYVGEEGIYTIAAMEMKVRGQYILNTLYGTNHGQPPLLNWLVIPLADLIGWSHVLVASRLVAACATIGSGLVLAWLVAGLTQDVRFAAFAALVYLTSDALIYHGWIAYTYPVLAFFTFSAIACLWMATVRQSPALAWVAAAAISCGALTKGISAYAFYAAAGFVLLCRRDSRLFLLRPRRRGSAPRGRRTVSRLALVSDWQRRATKHGLERNRRKAARFQAWKLPQSVVDVPAGNVAALRARESAGCVRVGAWARPPQ